MSTPRAFERGQAEILSARLAEPRRFLQVVAGARQVGKTTLVQQVLDRLDVPSVFVSADARPAAQLASQRWDARRPFREEYISIDAERTAQKHALDFRLLFDAFHPSMCGIMRARSHT